LTESSMDHSSFISASNEQGPRTLDYTNQDVNAK
jgi:hypothetical protein